MRTLSPRATEKYCPASRHLLCVCVATTGCVTLVAQPARVARRVLLKPARYSAKLHSQHCELQSSKVAIHSFEHFRGVESPPPSPPQITAGARACRPRSFRAAAPLAPPSLPSQPRAALTPACACRRCAPHAADPERALQPGQGRRPSRAPHTLHAPLACLPRSRAPPSQPRAALTPACACRRCVLPMLQCTLGDCSLGKGGQLGLSRPPACTALAARAPPPSRAGLAALSLSRPLVCLPGLPAGRHFAW